MNLESFSALDADVTKEDWERTPVNVQRLLRWLLEDFEQRLADLEQEKILSEVENEQTSKNYTDGQTVSYMRSEEIQCSFCGKKRDDVLKLISGPIVQICNECIEICNEILADSLLPENT
ncbi:MAG: ClpX C4-type zinc finger protein [Pyrinomonadaceae bacterium]|jgi:hypothetical protein